MIIEAGFCTLLFLAYRKAKKTGGELTPEEKTMFYESFENLRGENAPPMFRKLADGFEKYGHPLEAKLLRKRADYLDRTDDKKAEHNAIIKKAMNSDKADAIEQIANEFEKMTATGVARDLRQHAKEVRDGTWKKPEDKPVIKEASN